MIVTRLSTKIRVDALVRGFAARNTPVYVRVSGDAERGDLLLLLERPDGYHPYAKMLLESGEEGWGALRQDPLDPLAVIELINKRVGFDPDLWVLDVEDLAQKIDVSSDDLLLATL